MDQAIEIQNRDSLNQILNRESIFLDTNMWIKISRENNEQFREIKIILKRLFECGKIFCPLSKDIIRELLKQNYHSAKIVAEFMSEVSLNLCFRASKEIYDKEVELLVIGVIDETEYKLTQFDLFVSVVAFVSSKINVRFKHHSSDKRLDIKLREVATESIPKELSKLSILNFIEMCKERLPRSYPPFENQMTELLINRNKHTNRSIPKIRTIERTQIAKKFILPRIEEINNLLSPNSLFKLRDYFRSIPKDADESSFNHIFPLLPALNTFTEVMIFTGLNESKKYTINDFHDTEMMIVPLTYSDVFVSEDKNIRHILNKHSELTISNSTKIFSSSQSFLNYLESIECA